MESNIEFYEALRAHMPDEVARLIADHMPQTEELATKRDLLELRVELAELKADIRGWMLSFFVPLWIGVYGTLAAVVISILRG